MSDMKCPFCDSEIEQLNDQQRSLLHCSNIVCCKGGHYIGNTSIWRDLIHTRKALDVANEKLRHCVNMTVEELDELKGNLLIAYNALLHFSKDPIANNALKRITALEQKDVK